VLNKERAGLTDSLFVISRKISNFVVIKEQKTIDDKQTKLGRVLAIDYGRKRCGLAVTDPLRIIASPLTTVPSGQLETFLKDYIPRENVTEIVVGYPVTVNNLPSESVKYIDPFITRFRKLFPDVALHLTDERFTSQIAMRTIIDGGVKKSDRRDKGLADRISASIILQSWLSSDEKRKKNEMQ
jgi:putative Holliday junction resolvase